MATHGVEVFFFGVEKPFQQKPEVPKLLVTISNVELPRIFGHKMAFDWIPSHEKCTETYEIGCQKLKNRNQVVQVLNIK